MAVGVLEVLAALVAIFAAVYYYMTNTADYWAKRGVPFLKPTPFIGNSLAFLLSTEFRGKVGQRFYHYAKSNGHKYLGVFLGRRPAFIVCDVDLLKTMMVKDFQYLTDRGLFFDRHREPLSAHLFNLGGPEWKSLRAKLTPTFTTGKMKNMFYLVRACADQLDSFLAAETAAGGELEMAEVMAKFTTDVIGSCAFGVEANSLKDPDAQFRNMGRELFTIPRWRAILFVLGETMPPLRRLLPVPLLSRNVSTFFTSTFNENVRYREQSGDQRHDFVDLLIQLKKGDAIDPAIMPAQAFIFFIAGFETSSGATSACLMELAHHPDVQDRLREEVDRVLAKHAGVISYEALQEMTYMEQVLEETMRLYPALALLPRVVTRDYQLPDSKSVLEAGTRVLVPVYAIHRDPEFYPDPDRFDPERFTEENKRSRPHFAYIPFGEGPRICIGLRFAMMQMKSALTVIMRSYQVTPGPDSVYPMPFETKGIVTRIRGGVHVKISKRQARTA
ncbi:probable cytochrome P450 6a14 [Thrips palmi]|uniref:Probable cytochrome P450 6a14 n=1 Tax=Thrips palmi TaxID=161013 RepID=A0A6P8ZGM9_THRPL|nr:probable cytochrome P450 6a14 [Thrips palmi]XP_034230385.1 probable cytochrome P450 6a14 [Thrips palmi]